MATVQKFITIRHSYTRDEAAEFRRISAAREQLKKDEKALSGQVAKNPDAILAAKLAGYAKTPEVELTYNDATLKFTIYETVVEAEKPKAPAASVPHVPQAIYMDPKTLNTLLHGKLLSDAQKLNLISRTHQGLGSLTGDDPEATP